MRATLVTRRFVLVATFVAVVGAVAVVVFQRLPGEAPQPTATSIPDPDLGGVEPQVILKVRDARRAVQRHPSSAKTWGRLGTILDVHEFSTDAMYCYQRAAELDPSDFRWPYLLALAIAQEKPQASLSSLERAVQLNGNYLPARLHLAQQLTQENRPEEARGHYQAVLEADPTSFHAHLGMGQVLLGGGDLAASHEHLSRAVEIEPMAREGHSAMSRLFARLGDDTAAEHEMSLARRYPQGPSIPDPEHEKVQAEGVSARSYNMRGLELTRRGKHREALAQFRRAAESRSDVATFRGNLANTLMVLGQLDEAIKQYGEALRVDPSSARIRNHLAVALVNQGKLSEAEDVLQATLGRWPTDAETHHNLGVVYEKQGRLDEAIEQFELAIAARPNYALAYRSLGQVLAKADRLDDAITSLLSAKEANPTDTPTYQRLSNLLVRRAEFAAAADTLREGLALATSDATLAMDLAWLLASCQDPAVRNGAEALRVVRVAVEAAPTHPMVLDVLAAAQAESGDFETAVRTAQRALSSARTQGAPKELIQLIQSRLSLYRSGVPYRQSDSTGAPASGPGERP
ncbi:MAG: tetratricopeptide repeat protein [Phycisphaerales bacterium]